ncbi:hypothetical protein ACI2UK_13880 [Ralstonia nicotianae]|uniref:hypothetical protein n=1 Tax=Ralstonia pseudosolanacearum TaxID=1310165 RepID=UPI0020030CF7|nr:hypothetical protein [Ralstonia pseudosolanacearum]MCK4118367.1 hypothetical protein [Ralstonia pseudosolanacearum]
MREVDIGGRPKAELVPDQINEGDRQALAHIEAQAFARMLDRVFWHPEPHVLRFEPRIRLGEHGPVPTVVGVLGEGGEAWFAEELVPARWDYVAFKEIGWGLSKRLHDRLVEDGLLRDDAPGALSGLMPDFSTLQDPEERERYRWAVINRLREVARCRAEAATLQG